MITASEARSILAKSKEGQKAILKQIDTKIREAAGKGETLIQHDVPSEEWIEPIQKELISLGFGSRKLHSKGIDVTF